jgi:DNA polymerase III delta prime subunit
MKQDNIKNTLITIPIWSYNMQSKSYSQTTHTHLPWIEKYRPTSLSEVRGQDNAIMLFREMLSANRPLHFLFYGPSGTGKTSAVTSFCNELYGENNTDQYILSINASYDRGIDMVRNKIKPFCKRSTTPFTRNGHIVDYKFVILDEADTLTKDAQNALRRCIEIYSYNTRFCFLCNYVCHIITPILSRCSVCHFRPVFKPIAMQFLTSVCEQEGVQCEPNDLAMVYDKNNGDLRACLTTLQSMCNMLHGPITTGALRDYLQIMPDTVWHGITTFKQHKQCVHLATEWYEDGYSLRAILLSLVEWSLNNCTDKQVYALAQLTSRIEKQMFVCSSPLLLLLEIIVTVWETCRLMSGDKKEANANE